MRHYLFGSMQILARLPVSVRVLRHHRHLRPPAAAEDIGAGDRARWRPCWPRGWRSRFIVDDNLIGNKMAIKPVLAEMAAWQQANGYPLTFFTEASLDLAEDAELMQVMTDANITSVFVGIESPNEASLREPRISRTSEKGASIVERVHTIQDAGLDVWCGMILGFDHDDATIFDSAAASFCSDARSAARDDWHAGRDSQDSAARPAGGRGPAGRKRRAGVRHQRDSGPMTRAELRDGYVRVLRRTVRTRGLFRAAGRSLSAWRLPFRPDAHGLLAPASLAVAEGRSVASGPHRWASTWQLMRERARRAAAARPIGDYLWRLLRQRRDPVVLFVFTGEMRDALSPLHDGPAHGGRAAGDRQFVLTGTPSLRLGGYLARDAVRGRSAWQPLINRPAWGRGARPRERRAAWPGD